MTGYLLNNAWEGERQRLRGMEARYDPGSFRHLDALGVGAGWRCWDVGAGGGTVAAWLCGRVGPSGSVLATDVDTRFLDGLDAPNLEVRRHDVVRDPLPEGGFDLIHTRLLLMHLPQRELVIERLATALRPGGWLLLEEWDQDLYRNVFDPDLPAEKRALLYKTVSAFLRYARARDAEDERRDLGRRLFGLLRRAGLEQVGAEGRAIVDAGGDGHIETAPIAHASIRAAVVAMGDVTEAEMQAALALRRSPDFYGLMPLMVAAWGRRPPATNGSHGRST